MLSQRLIACRVVTTCIVLASFATPASGDDSEHLPDAAAAARAYAVTRTWLDNFSLPTPEKPESEVPMPGASGVCILLRRGGRVVATGVDAGGGPLMLRRAAGRAFGELLSERVRAARPDHDARRRITVELEVAGATQPLLGRTAAQVAAGLDPGLDGLALRRGEDWAMVFPSQVRATGRVADPGRLAPGLARELGLPPSDADTLLQQFQVEPYRFRSIDLLQPAPGQPPMTLYRGQRLVPADTVTSQRILEIADELARHIIRRRFTPPPGEAPAALGFHGDYDIIADHFNPLLATPLEQALLAGALARYAATEGVDPTIAPRAAATARETFVELAIVEPTEPDPLDHLTACGAIVWAGLEIGGALDEPRGRRLYDGAVTRILAARQEDGSFRATDGEPLHPHARALVVSALTRLLLEGDDRVDAVTVRADLDATWRAAARGGEIQLLPWIGWAETTFAGATGDPLARVEQLRQARDALDRRRIGDRGLVGAADLVGGFDLTPGSVGARLRATDQTLRPASWLATMLREPDLTPWRDAPAALGRHLRTVRFLMQLSVREDTPWDLRDARRATGGIRSATWTSIQPAAAQALGLLTITETAASLRDMARRSREGR